MEIDAIIQKIIYCIGNIYENDADLFQRNNYELTISSKLAQYLFPEFRDYNVDCEYDKHIDSEKSSAELNQNIRPDIVIHQRGTDNHNLVYIEIKKTQNRVDRTKDRNKIVAVTRVCSEYHYKLGVFIDFAPERECMQLEFYVDGRRI
jgi:hypothetical protein